MSKLLTNCSCEDLITELLIRLGEDPQREGLKKTPERVWRMLRELCGGAKLRGNEFPTTELTYLFESVFETTCDEMVVVKDLRFVSLCEHHMLPFVGVCHIGYLPDGKILGLSKFARVLGYFSRRLNVQENLTENVANAIEDHLRPKGVGVVMEARHLCMEIRGVKNGGLTTTSSLRGAFKTDGNTRREFLDFVRSK